MSESTCSTSGAQKYTNMAASSNTASNQVHFSDVSLQDEASIADLQRFYTEIYEECFPDPDERESFDHLLHYLEKAAASPDHRYHIILAKTEADGVVGGGIFNYYRKTNSSVIEFVSVKNNVQSAGLGLSIYEYIRAVLAKDAHHFCGKPLSNILGEIDSPEHSQMVTKKYLHFWNKHHFRRLNFDYVQPSLSEGQEPVYGLWFVASPQDRDCSEMDGNYVLDVLYDYMKYSMNIENPLENPEYQKMAAQIRHTTLKFLPILPEQ